MAHLRNHKVIETWKSHLDPKHLYHFTENDRVVRTGILGGNAKILFITENRNVLNFSGIGRRATIMDFRKKYGVGMAGSGWERVS